MIDQKRELVRAVGSVRKVPRDRGRAIAQKQCRVGGGVDLLQFSVTFAVSRI